MNAPDSWSNLHEGRLAAMVQVATRAGDRTLKYFRSGQIAVEAKSDDSPVTIADREAEQLVRELVAEQFPDDAVEGEEFDDTAGSSDYRWVVDPIDGTKSFICGVPLYSTLVALEKGGEPLGGVINIPATGEMGIAAIGHGSWYRRQPSEAWQPARVAETNQLSQAVFVSSQVDSFDGRDAADHYKRLESAAWITRTWGDGYGYLMVATGRAHLMIDPICNAWDVAAILPVLQEAGGRFTDWKGNPTTRGGDGVGTNGHLHDEVLSVLQAK